MSRAGAMRRVGVLILIAAAAAVAVRNDRGASEAYGRNWGESVARRWPLPVRSLVGPTLRWGSDLVAALIVTTAGLGLVALSGPFLRPGRRWPGRGVAAIAVAALALVYRAVSVALEAMADPTSLSSSLFLFNTLSNCEYGPKGAVLGAWSLLALAGRWKSEVDGFERLGRLVGWCWLATFAFDFFRSALW